MNNLEFTENELYLQLEIIKFNKENTYFTAKEDTYLVSQNTQLQGLTGAGKRCQLVVTVSEIQNMIRIQNNYLMYNHYMDDIWNAFLDKSDIHNASYVAQRTYIIDRGEIIFEGIPSEIVKMKSS